MSDTPPQAQSPLQLTALLRAWGNGDQDAGERVFPLVFQELRRQAARYMRRERREHTLQPTALVHEAYLRLAGLDGLDFPSRGHFFALAAKVMRRVLVDHARRRRAAKREGWRVTLSDPDLPAGSAPGTDLLALDEALDELTRLDPDQARIVELRFFAGLSVEETAQIVRVSPRTVKREWQTARVWLQHRLVRERNPRP